MTRYIDADTLLSLIETEKDERQGFMRDEDNILLAAEDRGFLDGLNAIRFLVTTMAGDRAA